jgi:uncharacterized protein (TIGR00661 family)
LVDFFHNEPKLRFFRIKKQARVRVGYKINNTVLVAPLDWGLGHCTRCIPIVQYLLQQGCTVILAAEGPQAKMLQQEFPALEILPLTGYRIRYATHKWKFALKILQQLPSILRSIKQENKWLASLMKTRRIDAVISDNRYGLYNPAITSIFITHQLQVKAPFSWAEKFIRRELYKHINNFSACWVPDSKTTPNLAGSLSHPQLLPRIPVHYLGPLSRLEATETNEKFDLLVLLSGPEPQRSILEKIIVQQLHTIDKKTLIVRGLPVGAEPLKVSSHVQVKNHLGTIDLQAAISAASVVIARSGYSTVMDLCKLQKKAILIPTPGQTEQEYLARHLHQQHCCLCYQQHEFNLSTALAESASFAYEKININMNGYQQVIESFLQHLMNRDSPASATFGGKSFS